MKNAARPHVLGLFVFSILSLNAFSEGSFRYRSKLKKERPSPWLRLVGAFVDRIQVGEMGPMRVKLKLSLKG